MCQACDSRELLKQAEVKPNRNRLMVLGELLRSSHPLSSQDILLRIKGEHKLNRVTLYRILDLLVEKRLLNRLASPDRTDRFCPNEIKNHPQHIHFFCETCKKMSCLPAVKPIRFDQSQHFKVNRVQVLMDGICSKCGLNLPTVPVDLEENN